MSRATTVARSSCFVVIVQVSATSASRGGHFYFREPGHFYFAPTLLRTAFRWTFGKVMMPMRVIFPRIPGYAFTHVCAMIRASE
jgi:hypothetical protein